MVTATPELEIWDGSWGLPSIDMKCLQVMSFAKFSGVPLKLKKSNNPWWSSSGELPVYRHGGNVNLTRFEDIVNHFKSQNYNADLELNAKQESDIRAYYHMLNEKLFPGLVYSWWVDSKNYIELTRPWYAKALPLPLNFFLPGSWQRKAKQFLLEKYGLHEEDESHLETMVFKSALECLTLLENRLGNDEFFFGRNPSSLDAIIFGYLAPLLRAPFPNPALQNHLKACDNLVRFVVRIIHRYFPSIHEEKTTSKSKCNPQPPNENDEFPHKVRNQILAGITAVFAMVGYALLSGLVQIDFMEEHDDPEEENEDRDDHIPVFYRDEKDDN